MGTMITPREVRHIPHIFIRFCPFCGVERVQDKRYKKEIESPACRIYRCSKTSITMECRVCKLRFMLTWRSLAEVFIRLIEEEEAKPAEERSEQNADIYFNQVRLLDKYFDTSYSLRKTPVNIPKIFPENFSRKL